MKGIQQRRTCYGSLDNTIITIEPDENTTLLVVDRNKIADTNNNPKKTHNTCNAKEINGKTSTLKYGLSSSSFGSSDKSNDSDHSQSSTKTFKSHFTEIRVLAFALLLATALIIATYLLLIESRLPSITLSLDLVSHDIWSHKFIPKTYHLKNNDVDHIIIMQTGNRNCDTSGECLRVLQEMQNMDLNQLEELPYNFLIGNDGLTYEVRGWEYPSNIKSVPPERSLVIGIIGNFDFRPPKNHLLSTIQSLVRESLKRRMINQEYSIYGLRLKGNVQKEGQFLFNEIMKWSRFRGFLSKF